MFLKKLLVIVVCLPLIVTQALAHPQPEGKVIAASNLYPQIKMETNKGVIVVELNRVKAPIAVNNFINYVIAGEYNNTIFHRVIDGFVVQGGGYDSNHIPRKNGKEIYNESGNGLKNEVGTIAMARQNDPHSAIRQFYFNVGDNTSLDPGRNWGYTVFGYVTHGEELLMEMAGVETGFNEDLNLDDVPVEPLILIKATLMPEGYIHEG
ncbi:peptidylprolyl isomerase [Thalassotalea mangrovi]|uniref:peptidylprolyl isomerase n=1 Tax=Thalassotalea mangrovi TaxID=2572245 RepID=A0A4V5NU45_9GAMM|nr:peptidylprolyl isomerase [Thalassotalea mangrovi]TKB44631.1 peptidyl-prolyl cis-trans isomerase [Thalassotalea mangrovi]